MNELVKKAGVVAMQVTDLQIKMVEEALRCLLVHVPTDECHLERGPGANTYTVVCRGVPMFRTQCDILAEDIDVEGWWLSWPPPQKSLRGRFSLLED